MSRSCVSMPDGFVHAYASWKEVAGSMYDMPMPHYTPAGDEVSGYGVNWTIVEPPRPFVGWEGMTLCGQMFHLKSPDLKTDFEGDLVDDAPTCLICAGRS